MRGVAVELLGEAFEMHPVPAQRVDGAHHLNQRAAEPVAEGNKEQCMRACYPSNALPGAARWF
jgi:hypothetical protein